MKSQDTTKRFTASPAKLSFTYILEIPLEKNKAGFVLMVFSDWIPFHRPSLLLSCFAEDPNHLGASPTFGRLYGYCWLESSKQLEFGCLSQCLQGCTKVLRSNSQHSSSALGDWKTLSNTKIDQTINRVLLPRIWRQRIISQLPFK